MESNQFSIDLRPRTFKDVFGHKKHIVDFRNSTKDNSFPQVMMFSGTTGTGKSTLANIVACVINCESPVQQRCGGYEPCCECKSCQDVIREKFSRDIVYKNASKMSKDDVNDLERSASQAGFIDRKKKIIIIEEAQELSSKGAKGALLKLLEKARKDVHFILLTMDEKAFDKSIRDRCQIYKFKPFSSTEVYDFLSEFIEKIDPNEELPDEIVDVASLISDNSGGSIRKAIQDLQRSIKSETFNVKDAEELFDYISDEKAVTLLLKLAKKDALVFNDLTTELEAFFIKTFHILIDVKKSSFTGVFKNKNYETAGKNLIKTNNLDNLLEAYVNIQESTAQFNRDKIIQYYLMKYMGLPVQKLNEEPVSRRRRVIVE